MYLTSTRYRVTTEKNIPTINKIYDRCLPYYFKSYFDPLYIVCQSQVMCDSCNNKFEYLSYSKFHGDGERYKFENFFIADLEQFNPEINGLYSREDAKRILEKFIFRWNLVASQVFIVSPFIGFGKKIEQHRDKGNKFMDLLDWLLTIIDKSKTKLIVRKTEYNKIIQFMSKELFNALDYYDLINPLISEIKDKTSPLFHAKFYAGIIPMKDKFIVEILSGSYNIHESSKTKENLIFSKLDFLDFNERYLQPLKIEYKCEFLDNLELLKIYNNNYKVQKINFLEDFWKS